MKYMGFQMGFIWTYVDYFYLLISVAPYKFLWDVVVGVAFRGGGWKEGASLEREYPGSPNTL